MDKEKIKIYKDYEQAVLLCSRCDVDEEIKEYVKELFRVPGFNWYEFLGISVLNRVNGVVYKTIKDMEEIPKCVKYFLEVVYLEQKERTKIHRDEIIKISKLLEDNNIRHVFLKGSVLNTVIYSLGDRISNDTDILVHVEDLENAVKLLKEEGYIQGDVVEGKLVPATKKEILFARLNTYEIVPLIKPVDERYLPFHVVDVNFRLGNDANQEESIELLENTVILEENGFKIRTLPMEEFLMYLCVHHYREAIMVVKIVHGDDLTLYKFMDIHYFLSAKGEDIDWEKLRDKVVRMNRIKDVYYTLYYAEQLYPGTISEEHLDLFKPEDVSFLNEYKGRDNTDEVYSWDMDFAHRVFSFDRQIEAMKNIADENSRFESIRSIIKCDK